MANKSQAVNARSASPGFRRGLLELRAGMEATSLLLSYPLLRTLKGNGSHVMVMPGFNTSDHATYTLRNFLNSIGFQAHGWKLGVNQGMGHGKFSDLKSRLDDLHQSTGEPISLVGFNMSGLYARALANLYADKVRSIITLATPFSAPSTVGMSNGVNRLYSFLSPVEGATGSGSTNLWEAVPKLPSTSIYSKWDGITDWQYCVDTQDVMTENITVRGSHLGLVVNPLIYYLIADRLNESPGSWLSFSDRHRDNMLLSALMAV